MLLAWFGVWRPNVYISNLVKYWPGPGNPDPDPEDIRRDEPLLLRELQLVRPKVVITLGRFATRYFLGWDAQAEFVNGIPHESKRFPGLTVIGVTHPAAGLHDPAFAARTYHELKAACAGGPDWAARNEAFKVVHWQPSFPKERFIVVRPATIDTEGSLADPYSLQLACSPWSALVVLAEHADRVEFKSRIIFHNAKHDLRMLDRMGVKYPADPSLWEDTMVRAYCRQDQPSQGLKSLGYRLLGRQMRDYEDVVRPHFNAVALGQMELLALLKFDRPESQVIEDKATGMQRWYRPQALQTRVKGFLRAYSKDPEKDLEKCWEDLTDAQRMQAAEIVGEFPRKSIRLVPQAQAFEYGGLDAVATLELERAYAVPKELLETYRRDMAIIPSLLEMESHGMPFDVEQAAALHEEFLGETLALRDQLRQITGQPYFNPGSVKQVGKWLFGVMGMRSTRKTKITGNDSSDDRALSTMKLMFRGVTDLEGKRGRIFQFVSQLIEYREVRKLVGTYTAPEALRSHVVDGVIHPTLKNTRVVSGRLASENPNLMNIPTRSERGKRIRACFRAPAGWCLLSGDLSQIELRILAHESRDPALLEVYRRGLDLHRITEREIFGVPDEQAGTKRIAAKTFNFRVVYAGPDGSPRGLQEQLFLDGISGLSEDQCRDYRDRWFGLYPGVRAYLARKGREARRFGFATTSGGRRRFLPFARLDDVRSAQSEAIRQAGNHGIQGGAQETIKEAMIRWNEEYRVRVNRITPTRLVMQIHDELMFLVHAPWDSPKAKRVGKLIVEMLTQDSDDYKVPILAEAKAGQSWADQKKLEIGI